MSTSPIARSDVEIDARALFGAFFRRLPFIVVFAALVGAATWYGLSRVTPLYLSETTVLLEPGEAGLTRTTATGEINTALGREAIQSQVQLIRSRDLGKAVVARLDLQSRAEFVPARETNWLTDLLQRFGFGRPVTDAPREEVVLGTYLDRLSVHAIDSSRVIAIGFSSEDPALAASVANAVAEEYIALQNTARRDSTADAAAWLANQIDDLRGTVEEAEAKVERYRTDNDLFASTDASPATLPQQQLSDFNAELTQARAARGTAEAKAAEIRAAIAAGTAANLPEVLASPLIQRLIEQQVTLRSEIAQLSATLLPLHPRMQALNAQLADLATQVAAETQKVLDGVEGEARLAAARESALQEGLTGLKTTAANANDASVQLRALEREASAQRELLDSYLARYREAIAREQAGNFPADARIVSSAAAPIAPNFPKLVPMTIAATTAALILAILFVLIRELAGGRPARQVAMAGPMPAMPEVVAAAPQAATMREEPVPQATREPTLVPEIVDPVEESLARIAADIADSGVKRIIVTLAADSDSAGRPLGAVALARALARTDARVVLVDLRRDGANAESMGDGANSLGFADLIESAASFAQVIFRDRRSRVHFIPSGRRQLSAASIDREQLETVLAALTLTYDYVVLDAGDDMIDVIAPNSGAAMVVSEHGATDERTRHAFDKVTAVSDARIMLLVVDPVMDEGTPVATRARSSAVA